MTGRDRLRATLRREPVDRVAIDLECTSAMREGLLHALKVEDDSALRKRLGVDMARVGPRIAGGVGEYYGHRFVRQLDAIRFVDSWGIMWQKSEQESGDVFFDVVASPLQQIDDVAELHDLPWPSPKTDFDFSDLASQVQALAAEGIAVVSGTAGVFDDTWRLRGMEQLMLDMTLKPDLAHALLNKVCDYWCEYGQLVLEAAGGAVDLMWTSDDLGTQCGPLMSPAMCREFVCPLIRRRAELYRKFGACVAMHSCGGVFPLIADFIAAGVAVLDPIQPRAAGMDRKRLKAEFGDRLIFHGSVDEQQTLVFGSAADVAQETRDCLATLGEGGGYILAASHVLEKDIPVENVLAMYDTAREYAL